MSKIQHLYKRGNQKLERELDVVNIIRSIRQLRLMSQVLLGPGERMLLKFQRKHLIESDPSSSDSDNHKDDTIKLLNSDLGLLRLQTVIKINRILKFFYLDKPLESVDRNLLSGIFVRRPEAAKVDEAMNKQYSVFGLDLYQR